MEFKPWEQRGSHRAGSDRRFERSDRREGGRSDRREDRGFGRSDRRDDRREDRRFGSRDDARRGGRDDRRLRRDDRQLRPLAVRSGPRARAFEMRRFSERHEFAKQGLVRLDSDLAQYFKSADDVNRALRFLVEASLLVKPELAKGPVEETQKPLLAVTEDESTDLDTVQPDVDDEIEAFFLTEDDDDMFDFAQPYGETSK